MAIKNKFIHFKTRAAFDNYLVDHADDLYNYTTFIKETSEIYTHGNFYKSSNTWDFSKLASDTSYAEVAFKTGKLGDAIALSDDAFSILMSINNNSWSLQFEEAIQELLYNPESKLFGEGTTKILAKDSSIPLGAISLPLSNGSAAIGKSDRYAKEDHIHPSDQSKQDKLVSGESIKTINNQSLLGEGNIITPDSKVTSAANHYTPKRGTITAGTIINSITKDEKGHIIGIKTANGLDASKITSGTINIERLPKGALERLVIVANQTARFALTTADVQEGDTVKQSDTGAMYFVINSTKLDNEAGYSVYTAGAATSVPWSGVTNAPTKVSQFTNDAGYLTSVPAQSWSSITDKPTTLAGYGITDAINNFYVNDETGDNYLVSASNNNLNIVGGDNCISVGITDRNVGIYHNKEDGYLHVPATGTTNNGKVLMAGSTAGSIMWKSIDLPEIPTALPNPYRLKINDATYTGSSAVSITVLKPLKITTAFIGTASLTVIEAGYSYSSTLARTVVSLDKFSESNPDAVIISTKKISFTDSNAIKMNGLENLAGTYYIYRLSYMANGKIAINGAVYT